MISLTDSYKDKFGGRFLYQSRIYNPNTYDPVYKFIDKYTGRILTIIPNTPFRSRDDIKVIDKNLSEIISNERNIKMDYIINKSI